MGEEGDGLIESEGFTGGDLWLEGKTFSKVAVDGKIQIRESYRKGDRIILLSEAQLVWVAAVVSEKVRCFGSPKKKVSKNFGEEWVSVSEGSNEWGVFLSVHTRRKSKGRRC